MTIDDLKKGAVKAESELGRAGISVKCAPGTQREVLAQGHIPHQMVRFSTTDRLDDANFEIEQTGGWPHHTIWLPGDWEHSDVLDRLAALFDEPVRRTDV